MKKFITAGMTALVMLTGTVAISAPAEAARKSSQTYP